MLQIGFANKYYTLWDVSQIMNGEHEQTYCSYLKNLAFKLEDAQAKAKAMGATNLEPDESLRGSSSFWRDYEPQEYIPETFEPWQFHYGRYKYDDIRENTDIDYLKWYHFDNQEGNEFTAPRILELDSNMVIYRKQLMTREERERSREGRKMEKNIKKNGYYDVVIESNVKRYGEIYTNVGSFIVGKSVELKWMSYQGFDYALPVNPKTGKGMRIKWKNARIYCSKKNDTYGEWEIDKIEIIKTKS